MTTQPDGDAVEKEVRISAQPETVFPFFIDPEKMTRWKETEAELDPRPGGKYRVNVTGRDVASGEYVEVTPNTRVVFTWGWEGDQQSVPPGSSTVEITLTPDGDGTLVRLRHYGLGPEEREGHAAGWANYLSRLVAVGEGRDPGPDPLAGAESMPP